MRYLEKSNSEIEMSVVDARGWTERGVFGDMMKKSWVPSGVMVRQHGECINATEVYTCKWLR